MTGDREPAAWEAASGWTTSLPSLPRWIFGISIVWIGVGLADRSWFFDGADFSSRPPADAPVYVVNEMWAGDLPEGCSNLVQEVEQRQKREASEWGDVRVFKHLDALCVAAVDEDAGDENER